MIELCDLIIFWDALNRILAGKPLIVSRNMPITYDLVALEAGRTRGSIRADRPQFAALRQAVRDAAAAQKPPPKKASAQQEKDKLKAKNREIADLKNECDGVRSRELMLVRYIDELEREIVRLRKPRLVSSIG